MADPDRYEPLKETQRQVEAEQAEAAKKAQQPVSHVDEWDAAATAHSQKLADKVAEGKIDAHEAVYLERRFDNEAVVRGNSEQAKTPERSEERETNKEPAGVEMTEARSARMDRLRTITQQIEQESRVREGEGLEPTRDSGENSR